MTDDDEEWQIEGRVRFELEDYLHAWFYAPGFQTFWQFLLFLPFGFLMMVLGSPVPWRQTFANAPWFAVAEVLGLAAAWVFRRQWAMVSFDRVGPRQISYYFDPEGLQVDSSLGTQRYAWDQLLSSVATSRGFLVFLSRAQFLLLPRRAFTATDLPEVAELLATLPSRRGEARKRFLRLAGVWLLSCTVLLVLFELVRSF